VPGDISAAAFFLVGAACLPGSDIILKNVGFNPTRRTIVDVLSELGISIVPSGIREEGGEPVTDLHLSGGLADRELPLVFEGSKTVAMIDELPILAILGTRLGKGLVVRDAAELRAKETDRISAVFENLKQMGADVTEYDDG